MYFTNICCYLNYIKTVAFEYIYYICTIMMILPNFPEFNILWFNQCILQIIIMILVLCDLLKCTCIMHHCCFNNLCAHQITLNYNVKIVLFTCMYTHYLRCYGNYSKAICIVIVEVVTIYQAFYYSQNTRNG